MSDTAMSGAIDRKRLLAKVFVRFGLAIVVFAAVIFLPAGSLGYLNGWLFIGTLFPLMIVALAYVFVRDPALLEKRMKTREKEAKQKGIVALSVFIIVPLFVLPGLDWRFGWSRVPAWVIAAGTVLIVAGYALFILVMRANSFLSRVVELQEGQKVIDTGPYALVRHPMYLSTLMIYFATPLVLGSWWALIPAFAYLPLIAARVVNEEALLAKGLPGYEEYRSKVRWRILPGLW
jgi:protein-S-isoprenylcysteine O-methyltransferase Ste14